MTRLIKVRKAPGLLNGAVIIRDAQWLRHHLAGLAGPRHMFGKSKAPPGSASLVDRVRQVAQRDSRPDPESASPARTSAKQSNQRAPRQAVYRHGVLVLNNGERLSVAIKNLSTTGARVEYFVKMELPERILLAEPTLKLRRYARVIWQADGVAGLQFLSE